MQHSSPPLDLLPPVYPPPVLPVPSMKGIQDAPLGLQPPVGAARPLSSTPASAFHKASHTSLKTRTQGRWCALHVSIAWHIYHNQKLKKLSKPDSLHREPASQFPTAESDWTSSRSPRRDAPDATSDLRAPLPAPVWDKPLPNWTAKTEEDVPPPKDSKPERSRGFQLEGGSSFVRVKRPRQEAADEPPVFTASPLYPPGSSRGPLVSYPGAETFPYPAHTWEPTWEPTWGGFRGTDYLRGGCRMDPTAAALKHKELLRSFSAPYFCFPSARRQQEAAYLRGERAAAAAALSDSLPPHLWKQRHCHAAPAALLRYHGYLPPPYLGP